MADPRQQPPPSHLPWRRRLHYRLIVSYGLLFITILTLLMALVINTVSGVQTNQAEHSLEVRALLAANALEDPLSGYSNELEEYERRETATGDASEAEDDEHDEHSVETSQSTPVRLARSGSSGEGVEPGTVGLQHLADRYANQGSLWVTIFDVRGDPIVDSRRALGAVGNQLGAPEFQAATRLVEQHDIRVDPATGTEYLFAAAPVQIGEQLLGVVRMAQPMSEVRAPIRTLARNLLLAGAAALLLATVLGFWLARRLVQPIRKLEATALAVAAGDLSRTADIQTTDEIGALARSFDYMVGELQATMRRQRLFIANASHELRTPLANIKLRSEALLALDGEEPALSKRYLREIDSEADRLGRLATVLLDLSKLDNPAPALPPAPCDLQPMLLAVARSMGMRMRDANLTFRARIAEELPLVAVHAEEVETVVLNLLDNAVKYTPAGGNVGLTVAAEPTPAGRDVIITVRDSGSGIPAGDMEHIFEYFYRVDKARSRQAAGTGSGAGLGLAIVQTLVAQNGGTIEATSVEGEGTSFTVRFPA